MFSQPLAFIMLQGYHPRFQHPQHPRSYIKNAIDYCKKPGNERLVKILSGNWDVFFSKYSMELSDDYFFFFGHQCVSCLKSFPLGHFHFKWCLWVRRDRYNHKLEKYYVVYEENDSEVSENEERHEQRDTEAWYLYMSWVVYVRMKSSNVIT